MGRNLQGGSTVKKLLKVIWEPFDSDDAVEWFLLLTGWTLFIVIILLSWSAQWT